MVGRIQCDRGRLLVRQRGRALAGVKRRSARLTNMKILQGRNDTPSCLTKTAKAERLIPQKNLCGGLATKNVHLGLWQGTESSSVLGLKTMVFRCREVCWGTPPRDQRGKGPEEGGKRKKRGGRLPQPGPYSLVAVVARRWRSFLARCFADVA